MILFKKFNNTKGNNLSNYDCLKYMIDITIQDCLIIQNFKGENRKI